MPTAKANQMAPSMATRDSGSWGLGGAKPHHMVPTPTSQDHIERQSTNKTPSTGKLNYETNKSVSLDRWAKMWPTPTAMTGGEKVAPSHLEGKHGWNIAAAVHSGIWPTPTASEGTGAQKNTGRTGGSSLREEVALWPTPQAQESRKKLTDYDHKKGRYLTKDGHHYGMGLTQAVKLWPTPQASDNRNRGNLSSGGVIRRKEKGKQINLSQSVSHTSGQLNPTWVAWLMGYPLEWLSCVPWETQSSRKSHRR